MRWGALWTLARQNGAAGAHWHYGPLLPAISYRKGPCVMPPSVDLSSISICIRIHVLNMCGTEFSATTTTTTTKSQRGRWTGTVIDFMRRNTIWLQNAQRPAETTNNFKFRFRFIGIFRSVDFIYAWFGERKEKNFYVRGFSHSFTMDLLRLLEDDVRKGNCWCLMRIRMMYRWSVFCEREWLFLKYIVFGFALVAVIFGWNQRCEKNHSSEFSG